MGRREASHGNRRLYCIEDPRFTKKKNIKATEINSPNALLTASNKAKQAPFRGNGNSQVNIDVATTGEANRQAGTRLHPAPKPHVKLELKCHMHM